jgi:putative ABC transport system ATP-binding protein
VTIVAEGVRVSFADSGGSPFVVLAIDRFTPGRGEITAVTGPSGSGKSTLLHVLAGLQPPDDGRVRFDDVDVYALGEGRRDRWRRHSIGLIFQDFYLIPELSIRANVTLPATFERGGKGRNGLRFLDRLRVPTAGRTVNALSRGEQQRVAIARAMAFDPPVILADEPTASLDAVAGAEIRAILRELAENGRTVVVVSHDPAIVSSADSVLRLERGMNISEQALAA